ncbi:DUF2474 family protein [Kordiimonas marina]|nr:DUF2474 family protein [Kordiimonas marina]MCJ9429613.1 DUF2474 family protein [Kordiimonas marina]
MTGPTPDERPLSKKLLWFAGLWVAGVLTVGVVAYGLRLILF